MNLKLKKGLKGKVVNKAAVGQTDPPAVEIVTSN